jgi:hypothetical protein
MDALFGWYARTDLGCKFDTIAFTESIAANTSGYAVTLTSAQDGAEKKGKLSGYNFIITDVYTGCTTGLVSAKILPDNDISTKFYTQIYQPIQRHLPVPLLLMTDLVIEFDNAEGHVNNAYLSFDGFWINEDVMPTLTMLSELIPSALANIDLQTLAAQNILEAMAEAEGLTPPDGDSGWTGYVAPPEYEEFCKRGRCKR